MPFVFATLTPKSRRQAQARPLQLLQREKAIGALRRQPKGIIKTGSAPKRWVAGRARTSGVLAFYSEQSLEADDRALWGFKGDSYAHLVLVLSEGACDGIEGLWLDGEHVPLATDTTNPHASVFVPSFSTRFVFDDPTRGSDQPLFGLQQCFSGLGTDGSLLRALFPGEWSGTRLRGISYIHIWFRQPNYEHNVESRFWSKLPNVEVLMRGMKLTWPGQTEPLWTDDASVVRRWWLEEVRNVPSAAIDSTSFAAAHAVTNQDLTVDVPRAEGYDIYRTLPVFDKDATGWRTNPPLATNRNPVVWRLERKTVGLGPFNVFGRWRNPRVYTMRETGGGMTSRNLSTDTKSEYRYLRTPNAQVSRRYSVNGIFSADDDVASVERDLDFAWSGRVIESGGVHYFYPGTNRTPALVLDAEVDIVEPPSAAPSGPVSERANSVSVSLAQSRAASYQEQPMPAFVDKDAQDRDGELHVELGGLAYVNDPLHAGRLQAQFVRRSRASLRATYRVRGPNIVQWLNIQPGQIISLADPVFGFDELRVEVLARSVHEDWSVELVLAEAPEDLYSDELVLPPLGDREIDLGSESDVPPVTGLTVKAGFTEPVQGITGPALLVSWDAQAIFETEIRLRAIAIVEKDLPNPAQVPQPGFHPSDGDETTYDSAEEFTEEDINAQPWTSFAQQRDSSLLITGPPAEWGWRYEVQARHISFSGIHGAWSESVNADLVRPTVGAPQNIVAEVTAGQLVVTCDAAANRSVRAIAIRWLVRGEDDPDPDLANDLDWAAQEPDVHPVVANEPVRVVLQPDEPGFYWFAARWITDVAVMSETGYQTEKAELYTPGEGTALEIEYVSRGDIQPETETTVPFSVVTVVLRLLRGTLVWRLGNAAYQDAADGNAKPGITLSSGLWIFEFDVSLTDVPTAATFASRDGTTYSDEAVVELAPDNRASAHVVLVEPGWEPPARSIGVEGRLYCEPEE